MAGRDPYRVYHGQICIIFKYCGLVDWIDQYHDFNSLIEFLQLSSQTEEIQFPLILVRRMYDFLTLLYDITEDFNHREYEFFANSVECVIEYNESSFEEAIEVLRNFSYKVNPPDFIGLTVFAAGMIKKGYTNRQVFKKVISQLGSIFGES